MNIISKLKSTINNWWISLVLGFLFLLGSFYIFTVPVASYLTLSILFATLILFDGIGCISLSLSNRDRMEGWGWQFASGLISVFIGFSLFIHPGLSMTLLPIFIGFWVLMKGGLIMGTSIDLKSQ